MDSLPDNRTSTAVKLKIHNKLYSLTKFRSELN